MNALTSADSLPAKLDEALRAISACEDMAQIKRMNDQAAALILAAKAVNAAPDMIARARRVKNEALLRMGDLLKLKTQVPPREVVTVEIRNAAYRNGIRHRKISRISGLCERTEASRAAGIRQPIASLAVRLASGGGTVRDKVRKAPYTDNARLARLAPRIRSGRSGNEYRSQIASDAMKLMNRALVALTEVANMQLKNADPLDKPRIKMATVRAQETLDSIEELL